MKIHNKRELQQIVFKHSSDIDFQDFMHLYKKCTAKPYFFFVIDTTFTSDKLLRFRKNIVERIQKLIMTTGDKLRDEKLQYNINSEKVKISAAASRKIDKYEFFTGEEILPSDQSRIIEQAKFTHSPLGKAFEKQTKTIEEQGQKQVKALEVLKPEENKEEIKSVEGLFLKEMTTNEIKNEIDEIKKWEEILKGKDLKYEKNKYINIQI